MQEINNFFFSGLAHSNAEQKQGQRSPYVQFTLSQVTPAKGQYPEKETQVNFAVFGDLATLARGIKKGDRVLVQGRITSVQRGEYLNPSFSVSAIMIGQGQPLSARPQAPRHDTPDLNDPDQLPF